MGFFLVKDIKKYSTICFDQGYQNEGLVSNQGYIKEGLLSDQGYLKEGLLSMDI